LPLKNIFFPFTKEKNMPGILSISYDSALLQTRALMLSSAGFEVESAIGFTAAIQACKQGTFDLVILGHSIPTDDKSAIINQLKDVCSTPILALQRPGEPPVTEAEYNLDSGSPQRFLKYVKEITRHNPPSEGASRPGAEDTLPSNEGD
jgi:CheY-like chemotaxis protein